MDKDQTTEKKNKQENENEDTDRVLSETEIQPNEEIKKITPEEEIKILKDKVARAYAELENQRRRYEKEKDEAFEYGGFSFAKEALNLLDNLERSKVSLNNDETLKDKDSLKKIIEHLEIINNDMLNIFKKNNIEPIHSIGQKLDPNLHQAMMEVEDVNKENGTIVQEIQKGFMMKDRLLRPSLVAVSKKITNKNSDDKKSEENQEKKEKN